MMDGNDHSAMTDWRGLWKQFANGQLRLAKSQNIRKSCKHDVYHPELAIIIQYNNCNWL